MIKFLLGIAVVAFTSFCGHFLSKKYRIRKVFFKQWKEFNERFLSEISYYRRPLRQFIEVYSYQGEFQQLLHDFYLTLDERTPLEKILSETDAYAFLKAEEKRGIEDYFLMIGKGDSASQKTYFSSVKERLATLQQTTETEAKRYGDLYVKLGFLCGLLILILIV